LGDGRLEDRHLGNSLIKIDVLQVDARSMKKIAEIEAGFML